MEPIEMDFCFIFSLPIINCFYMNQIEWLIRPIIFLIFVFIFAALKGPLKLIFMRIVNPKFLFVAKNFPKE